MFVTRFVTGFVTTHLALTSGALIGVMAAASAALIVVTLGTWRRAAHPGTRHVLARFGLLAATNLAVAALIFLAVNRVFGFYVTWSELLGTSKSTGVLRAAPSEGGSTPAAGGGADGSQSGPPGPLPGGAPQPDGRPPAPQAGVLRVLSSQPLAAGQGTPQDAGRLQTVRIYGERSGITADGYVYLPPQYTAAWPAAHQFAVVVVISDRMAPPGPGTGRGQPRPGDRRRAEELALTAYGQVAAGRAAPAIYVILPATVAPGDQACLDVPAGPQAATFFSQDIPAAVQAAYRTSAGPAGWGLLGDASGGYCAVQLAMTNSDRFALAAAPPADYRVPPGAAAGPDGGQASGAPNRASPPAGWLFGGSPLLRDEADLLWRLRQAPPQPITVLFTGTNAGELSRGQAFMAAVRPPMRGAAVTLASGPQPFAPVIDRVSRELSAWD